MNLFFKLKWHLYLSAYYHFPHCKDLLCNIWEPTNASVDKNHDVVLKFSPVLDSCNTCVSVTPVPMSVIPGPRSTVA